MSGLTKALLPGTITLLCGGPGASKSLMLLQAAAFWHDEGIRAIVCELEEDREFHLMRVLAQRAEIAGVTDPEWIRTNPELARDCYERNKIFIDSIGRFIHIADSQQTLEQIGEWIECRAKANFRIIAVDPVTAAAETDKPWIVQNTFLRRVEKTARQFGCSVLLVTHPVKSVSLPDMS